MHTFLLLLLMVGLLLGREESLSLVYFVLDLVRRLFILGIVLGVLCVPIALALYFLFGNSGPPVGAMPRATSCYEPYDPDAPLDPKNFGNDLPPCPRHNPPPRRPADPNAFDPSFHN